MEVGFVLVVDQVQLDLEAGHRLVELERTRREHAFEDVKVLAHLLAVALAFLACVALRVDLGTHVAEIITRRRPAKGENRVSVPAAVGACS